MPLHTKLALSWCTNQRRRANTHYGYSQYRDSTGWKVNNNRSINLFSYGTNFNVGHPTGGDLNYVFEDISYIRQDVLIHNQFYLWNFFGIGGYAHNVYSPFSISIGPLSIQWPGASVRQELDYNFRVGLYSY